MLGFLTSQNRLGLTNRETIDFFDNFSFLCQKQILEALSPILWTEDRIVSFGQCRHRHSVAWLSRTVTILFLQYFCFGTDVSIFRNAAVISGMTLLSRITGLIRDILIARVFGVSGDTDAYYVAFRLPNLLRRLFAEGAFQQAFVPMLADVRSTRSPHEAKSFIDKVASLLAFVVLVVSILGVLAAPVLVWVIASGLTEEPTTFDTAVQLTRYMFPYIFFMSMVALSSSILNTCGGSDSLKPLADYRDAFYCASFRTSDFCTGNRCNVRRISSAFCSDSSVGEARSFSEIHQSDNRS